MSAPESFLLWVNLINCGCGFRAETEAAIRKIQAQSEAEIASATKHAAQDLKAYAAKLALDVAEQQIRERMTVNTQEQFTDGFVSELRARAGHA